LTYIDAIFEKENNLIKVVERNNGQREYVEYPAEYVLYYEDARGNFKSMWGDSCMKFSTNDRKKFEKEIALRHDRKIHESDINPIFRCLENNYLDKDTPKLNICFLDIEVDFNPKKGFASPWDPFSRITAISTYQTSCDKLVTLVLKPDVPKDDKYYLDWDAAEQITNKFDNCFLCESEEQLLNLFLDLIDNDDILSGWNSMGYDLPYIVNRIERILGKEQTKRLCLWDRKPRKRDYIKYKKKQSTYELSGRIHLDYLDLYTKHNTQQLHSYRLDFVGEIEVGENKVPYEGTLDMLYKQDFEKFIAYNRQDTLLLFKIDQKRKFIELANQLAHTNSVLLPTTMGSVALIEQAIVNETHQRGMVVSNKKHTTHGLQEVEELDDVLSTVDDEEEDGPAVGAYVADPKIGLHSEIACCDINSLYPSTLRALNMGPETLVGQIRCNYTEDFIANRLASGTKTPDLWEDIFCVVEFDMIHKKTSDLLTVDFIDGNHMELTATELYDFIFDQENAYCLSSNGTIFRTDIEAIIPGLLKKWYAERKIMQADAAKNKKLAKEETDPVKKRYFLDQEEFWDQRQLSRKILLNALYGSILNPHMRFYDKRIGQSVTLTGRSIAKHMNAKINEIITGEYNYKGDAISYADTDSVSGNSLILTSIGEMTIEELFNVCAIYWIEGDKEYAVDDKINIVGYSQINDCVSNEKINYVYRHKVSKKKFRITDNQGNQIVITSDHSLMVERDNVLTEIKPSQLVEGDTLITVM
jgi:DNA polymerase elongation subunit (family B)